MQAPQTSVVIDFAPGVGMCPGDRELGMNTTRGWHPAWKASDVDFSDIVCCSGPCTSLYDVTRMDTANTEMYSCDPENRQDWVWKNMSSCLTARDGLLCNSCLDKHFDNAADRHPSADDIIQAIRNKHAACKPWLYAMH